MAKPNIFTVPLHESFIDVLAQHLLAEYGARPEEAPLVLLPSRRSCRALREAMLRAADGAPMLLPRMRPVGEVDEEALMLLAADSMAEQFHALPDAVEESERLLLLTRLVANYHDAAYGKDNHSIEQAMKLAAQLIALLDEVQREEIDPKKLQSLVNEEVAEHWQQIYRFLEIVFTGWPPILGERRKIDPIERRGKLHKMLAANWKMSPPTYPVIAAGTTGSIPATAQLLKTVAFMPKGKVILPGLLTAIDDDYWNALEESHPQYSLKQLLGYMGASRKEIEQLSRRAATNNEKKRVQLIEEIMRPASLTHLWRGISFDGEETQGLEVIECAHLDEEAQIVALKMRQCLEDENKTAALITHDRDLARRVRMALQRYGVEIDDSAGAPLLDRPAGVFMRLIAEAIESEFAPVELLSLLKHPLAALDGAPADCREFARELEREEIIRGVRPKAGIDPLIKVVSKAGRKDLQHFLVRLEQAYKPLMNLKEHGRLPFETLLDAHIAVAEAIARTADEKGGDRLWKGNDGTELAAALEAVRTHAHLLGTISWREYPLLFAELLKGQTYRPAYGLHPRLHILSPLESRLQQFDVLILSGLNEGTWPEAATADPWMSRPMRREIGLPILEKNIGLSAHDFMMLLSGKEVLLTRAQKVASTPTVPSRWLLRMQTLLGWRAGASREPWREWAEQLNAPESVVAIAEPAPKPPVIARPKSLWVTQMERLRRDPYSIYASTILKLKKLDELDQEPGVADFGILVHKALELFIRDFPNELPADAFDRLIIVGRGVFSDLMDRPAVDAFWWPRFTRIAEWFVAEEKRRRAQGIKVIAEEEGKLVLSGSAGDFTVRARIDRMELNKNGEVIISDYKTGTLPDLQLKEKGVACQLPLEALMVMKGEVASLPAGARQVMNLEFWLLKGGEAAGEIIPFRSPKMRPLEDIIELVERETMALIELFMQEDTPYLCVPIFKYRPSHNDYEHLARIKEWAAN